MKNGRDPSTSSPPAAGASRPAARLDGQSDPGAVWAQPHVEELVPEPGPAPEARAWFASERRASVTTRVARRSASIVAIGALAVSGIAITAFADDATPETCPTPLAEGETCPETAAAPEAPAPEAPAPEAPAAEAPAPEAPAPEQPKAEEPAPPPPAPEEPKAEEPAPEQPKAEEPKAEEPKADEPAADATTTEPPAPEQPKADEPTADEAAPADAPADAAPSTQGEVVADPVASEPTPPADDSAPTSTDATDGATPPTGDATTTPDPAAPPVDPAAPDATAPVAPPTAPEPSVAPPAEESPLAPPAAPELDPSSPGWSWSGAAGRSALDGLVSSDGTTYRLTTGTGVGAGLAAVDPSTDEVPFAGGTPTFGGWNIGSLQRYVAAAPAPAPLPDTRLLTPEQAEALRAVALREQVAWTVLAAAARTKGGLDDASSAPTSTLSKLAGQLRDLGARADASRPFASQSALASLLGSDEAGERAAALAAYYYAVGLVGLRDGLLAAQPELERSILEDGDIDVYAGGRNDIASHRVDPRILMSLRLLEARFGTVGVSCLISGHPIFTTSGNVSAHIFGRAVDVSHLGGENVTGHMGPDSRTENAIRLLLMLPNEVEARQIISLMDLDGPTGNTGSFAMADHSDHIHIGF